MILSKIAAFLPYAFVFTLLYLIQVKDFYIFHTIIESYTIVVAFFVFYILYYFQKESKDNFFNIVAVAFLSVGVLDFFHLLFYSDFIIYSQDSSIAFWMASRFIESFSLLLGILYNKKHFDKRKLLLIYSGLVFVFIIVIFTGYFPLCFDKELGLSKFKIYGEYFVVLLFIISLILLKSSKIFTNKIALYISLYIILMSIGEYVFTLYTQPSNFIMSIGHLFKVSAYYYLYKTVAISVIKQPFGFFIGNLLKNYENLNHKDKYNQLLLDSINSYILVLRTNGKIVNVNRKTIKFLKTDEEDILNRYFWETSLVKQEDKKMVEELFLKNKTSKNKLVLDLKIPKWHEIIFFTWEFSYINSDTKNETLIVCTGKDITELRKKSFYLDRSSNIIEHLPVMIVITDENANIEYVNPEFEKITGYTKDELIGGPVGNLKSDTYENKSIAQMWRELKNDNIWRGMFYNVKKNQEEYTVKSTIFGLKNAENKTYYVAIQEDITKNIKIKQTLFQKSQLLDTVFNSVPAMIWIKDLNNYIVKGNKQAADFSNMSLFELEGAHASAIFPDMADSYHEDDKLVIETKRPLLNMSKSFHTKDGELRWMQVDKIPIFNDEHAVTEIMVFAVDVTNQKELEDILRDKEASAIKQSKEKTKFLSNISHELNTPMNTILGYAQILHNENAVESSKHNVMLKSILSSGYFLMNLISELLDITRIESGKLEANNSYFDLKKFLETLYSTVLLQIDNGNITIFFEGIPHEELYIYSDRQKLYNILLNIINNAVKFTQNGGISLLVINDDDNLRFVIEDTGCGIEQKMIDKIYSPYYQTEIGVQKGGLGLGLSIVKEYVHILGGNIDVESEVGKGTKFTINFPLKSEKTVHKQDSLFSILILDDINHSLYPLQNKLKEFGVDVVLYQYKQEQWDKIIEYIVHNECIIFINDCKNNSLLQAYTEKLIAINNDLDIYIFSESPDSDIEISEHKNIFYKNFDISTGELFDIIYRYNGDINMNKSNKIINKPSSIEYVIPPQKAEKIIMHALGGDKMALESVINEIEDENTKKYLLQLVYNFKFQKIIDILNHDKGRNL